MATEATRELINAVTAGRMSRREFVIKALALGISVSGIISVLASLSTPAEAQSSGGTYTLLASSSPDRSNPTPLAGKTVSGNIYAFTSPGTGVYRVRFYLDDPNMTGTPRRIENNPPHDFAGGAVSTANPFDTFTVSDGSHTITAAVELSGGGTEVVHATFTVANRTVETPDQVHLAWVADPSTTLTVVWRTLETATPSTVQYRTAGSTTWLEATGAQRTSGTTGKLHETTLSDLTPSTSYEYRVRGDGESWSEIFSTRTAPPTGPADFDIIYFADTGLVGRKDGLATGTKQVVDEIAAINPLLVLPGGDYAYYNTDTRYGALENTIDAWFNQVQPIASRSPMMPTYGNHEVVLGEGYEPWANRFPTPEGWNGRRAYSFDIGDVHFISVFAVYSSEPLTVDQVGWLENDIAAAKAAGRRWIIPYMHAPAFADGTNHPSNLKLRAQLGPIFERNGIKFVLCSHDQAYERTYPLTDIGATNTLTSTSKSCYEMSDGVTWIKISPGGKLSNLNKSFSSFATDPPPAWTAYRNNTTHVFSRLTVSASGSIQLDTYGVKGDGTPPVIIDTFKYSIDGCQDTSAPAVVAVTPAEGATGVSASTNVTATLSKEMDAATINGTTFTLLKQGTTPVSATVTYDAATKKAILDPGANLDEGATYIATIKGGTGGVKDLAGNTLTSDKSWSFTTATAQTGTYTLLVSSSSNRSNPTPLAGKTVSGNIYAFTSPDFGVYRVRFHLDDPNMSGSPRRTEKNAPYDFAGGSVSTANPFDTRKVSNGSHTITAAVEKTGGGAEVVHASFTVTT